jgi:hypothetical protein
MVSQVCHFKAKPTEVLSELHKSDLPILKFLMNFAQILDIECFKQI